MPIIKDDEEMAELVAREPLISGVISNARRIQVRVDDSVARVIDGQPQMIRRSK
jgi:hydrogenase maturation protein HypF